MSFTGKGENLNPLFPGQLCPEGKRRAKLLPPKSRRAKSEGLRDVPAADKGFRAGEGARSWLRGCWPGCHGFCANQPLACREAEGKGSILSVEELPPYLAVSCHHLRGGCARAKGQNSLEQDILVNDVPGCGSDPAVLSCRAARVVPPLGCG